MKRDPPSVIAGPAEALCFSGGGKTNRFIRLKNIEHPLRNQGQWLSETRKLLRLNTEKRIRFLTHGLSQFTRKAKGNERWMRENLKIPVLPEWKPWSLSLFSLSIHHFPVRQSFDSAVRRSPQHFTSSPLSLSSFVTSLHTHADSPFLPPDRSHSPVLKIHTGNFF